MNDEATSRNLLQRNVASMLLSVIGDHGFALAGAGVIREHALTDRSTTDVDLFGPPLTTAEQFAAVVELVEHTLSDAGYNVQLVRPFAQFARLRIIKDGADVLDVDLALGTEHDDGFDAQMFAEQLSPWSGSRPISRPDDGQDRRQL